MHFFPAKILSTNNIWRYLWVTEDCDISLLLDSHYESPLKAQRVTFRGHGME